MTSCATSGPASAGSSELLSRLARSILRHARLRIEEHLGLKTAGEQPLAGPLPAAAGLFVVLRDRRGDVRGAVGEVSPVTRIEQAGELAVAAAFDDPRFPPLGREELADVAVEAWLLAAPRPVHRPEEIHLPGDAISVRQGILNAVLLPDVAIEHGWGPETFLAYACRQAGLPADAWQDQGTAVTAYETFAARER